MARQSDVPLGWPAQKGDIAAPSRTGQKKAVVQECQDENGPVRAYAGHLVLGIEPDAAGLYEAQRDRLEEVRFSPQVLVQDRLQPRFLGRKRGRPG